MACVSQKGNDVMGIMTVKMEVMNSTVVSVIIFPHSYYAVSFMCGAGLYQPHTDIYALSFEPSGIEVVENNRFL